MIPDRQELPHRDTQDVGRVPPIQAQHARFQAGREDRLHQSLTRLEIFSTDGRTLLVCQIHQRGNVHRKIRRAIREGNPGLQSGIGVDHRRRNRFVIVAHRLLEGFQRAMNRVLLHEHFGRRRPNHYQPIAFVFALEFGDLVD